MRRTTRLVLLLGIGLLLICNAGMAATSTVDWAGLQAAITAAAAGDTVQLAAGTYDVSATTINVAKAIVVDGSGSTLNLTGGGNVFRLSNGATLQGFSFSKVDTSNQEIVYVGTPNVSVLSNTFHGTYVFPSHSETTRAMVVQSGASNVTISGNTISNLRQPAYVNWGSGTISNNSVSGTKGWVIDTSGSQVPYTITGNTFSGNVTDDSGLTDLGPTYGFTDICLIGSNSFYDPVALSAANNHAVVVDKTNGGATLRVLNRTQSLWYTTVGAAVAAANPGDAIECSGGPYNESVTVDKALTITGAGDEVTGTVFSVASGATSFNITASNVTLEDLRVKGTSWAGTGIVVTGNVDTIALNNLTITGTFIGVSLPVTAEVSGLAVSDCDLVNNNGAFTVAGRLDGLDMSGCHLDDNSTGLRAHDGTSALSPNLIFTNVNISNSSFSRNQIKGIYVEKLNNANLSNITIDGSGNNLGYPKSGCAGIDINCKDGSFSNITISNLNVNNSGIAGGAGGGAVVIKGRNDGTYAANPGQLSNVTISGATITNCGIGLSFGNNLSGITVSGANITPTASGVGMAFWSLPSGDAISSLNATINGPAALGVALSDIPSGDIDLGNVSLDGSLTEFIRVQSVPATIIVDAQSVSFGDAATDADKEAKVYHYIDDSALAFVDWGQQNKPERTSLVVSAVTGSVGQTVQLSAKLTAAGVGLPGQSVAFSVDGSAVASGTTDAAGVAAVPYGPLTAGNKTITAALASSDQYYGCTGTGTLTVEAAAPTAITLTLTPSSLVSGAATTCTVLGDNGEDLTANCTYYVQYGAGGSWSTVAPKNIYTAAKAGTWNVTAVYNTLTDTKPLTVTAGAATAVTLTPATATINADEAQTYVVTATDAAGNVSTPAASCLSHNGAGSLTDYTYTAAAGDAGNAVTITATVDGQSATATLNVNPTAGAGTILAWDKDTKKFYLCSNATNPEAGTVITGSGTYDGIPVVMSGTGTNVTVTAAGASLRVTWYLRSGALYRAYQYSSGTSAGSKTATFDGTRTLVDGAWKSGFYGLTHTISGGTATYGSAQQ